MSKPNPWPKRLWEFPLMSRDDAETLIRGKDHGAFIVRPLPGEDGPIPNAYVITVSHHGAVIHNLIEKKSPSTPFTVNDEVFGSNHTPESMVEQLRLEGEDLEICLKRPLRLHPSKVEEHVAPKMSARRNSVKLSDKRSVPCLL